MVQLLGKARVRAQAQALELQAQVEDLSAQNLELAKKAQQALSQLKNLKQAALSEPSDYLGFLKAENLRLKSQVEQLQLETPLRQSMFLTDLQLRNLALLAEIDLLKSENLLAQSEIQLAQAQVPALQSKYRQALRKVAELESRLERGEYPDSSQGCCHSDCC